VSNPAARPFWDGRTPLVAITVMGVKAAAVPIRAPLQEWRLRRRTRSSDRAGPPCRRAESTGDTENDRRATGTEHQGQPSGGLGAGEHRRADRQESEPGPQRRIAVHILEIERNQDRAGEESSPSKNITTLPLLTVRAWKTEAAGVDHRPLA